jgi:hypothetical protein
VEYISKIKLESLIAIIGIILLGGAFYLYKIKYSVNNINEINKTQDELRQDAKKKMLAGELSSFAGRIIEISDDFIIVKAINPDRKDNKEEVKVFINKDTLVRKIILGNIPKDSKSVKAEEINLKIENIKLGDEVFLDVDKNNFAVVIDIMRSKAKEQPIKEFNTEGIIEGQGVPLFDI